MSYLHICSFSFPSLVGGATSLIKTRYPYLLRGTTFNFRITTEVYDLIGVNCLNFSTLKQTLIMY